MKKKKKFNPVLDTVKNTVVGGTGLMVGSMTMGKVAGLAPGVPGVQAVESTAQGALSIGAIGLPIGAAAGVMKQTEMMFDQPKMKKKKNMYL